VTQPPPSYQGYPPPGYPPPGGYSVPQPPPGYRLAPAAPNGAPLADFGTRLAAYLLDGLIVSAVVLIPYLIAMAVFLSIFLSAARTAQPGSPPPVGTWILAYLVLVGLTFVITFLAQYLYVVVYQVRKGQTVGKRVMKIKVIRLADGMPMNRNDATRRWLVTVGCSFLGPLSWLDGLWQLWDQPYRQCLHDKWPQTVVVRVPA
jgi:RDD family